MKTKVMDDMDLLPLWDQDPGYLEAKAEVDRLTPLMEAAERDYRMAWAIAVKAVGTNTPPIGSPAWAKQQDFFLLQEQHKAVTRKLQTAKWAAQESCQSIALAAGLRLIEAEIKPAIEALLPVIEKYEDMQQTVYAKSGTMLPDLGRLRADSLRRWLDNVRAQNKFGTD